jgi:hypothetical protein
MNQGEKCTLRMPVSNKLTHVDSQLPQVRVQLTREAQAGGDTRHNDGNKVVKVAVCRCRELKSPKADVVERLVVDAEGFVRVLDKLVDGEGSVVGLIDRDVKMSIHDKFSDMICPTSTTVSETLGLGTTEYVHIILSGYSSRIFEIKRVPIPAPVPPPSE